MRRLILLMAAMAAAVLLVSGVAYALNVQCDGAGDQDPDPGQCEGTDNADALTGTANDDDMRGLIGQDTLNAKVGFDTLRGGRGGDTLNGDADNDTLIGQQGADALNGGAADDTYQFGNGWGADTISDDAALGTFGERLTFSLVTQPITMDLISSPARPEVRLVQSGAHRVNFGPNVSINEVDGSSKGDTIKGDSSNDFLNGIQGNDTIVGRGGNDEVVGMDGNDTIRAADNEADSISCGGGNDDRVIFDQNMDTFLNINACEDRVPR